MEYKNLEILLNQSKNIIKQHIKDKEEKGEDFNIFSILGMESNETKTHSAMLVALLNPKGNHYYQDKFLKLFLEEIEYKDYKDENLMLVQVKAEHHLGKISEDFTVGGFIDILITFPSGKAIAIENKIYAGDQKNQMFRYSLHGGTKCALYYLNLFGDKPTENSLNNLGEEQYDIITYNNQILNWLDKCLLTVKAGSIVENAIKQYQILIKNLTNTMDKHLDNTLNDLILKNLEEAKYIHAHYEKAVFKVREKLRNAICDAINNSQLSVKAYLGNNTTHVYSQIWLTSNALKNSNVHFGLESFSGKGNNNGRILIGIFDKAKNYEPLVDGDYRLNAYWPLVREIKTPSNNPLNLNSTKTLEQLSIDSAYFEEVVNEVVDQTKDFVEVYDNLFS